MLPNNQEKYKIKNCKHAVKGWNTFRNEKYERLPWFALKSYLLLLADVFENFRKESLDSLNSFNAVWVFIWTDSNVYMNFLKIPPRSSYFVPAQARMYIYIILITHEKPPEFTP